MPQAAGAELRTVWVCSVLALPWPEVLITWIVHAVVISASFAVAHVWVMFAKLWCTSHKTC